MASAPEFAYGPCPLETLPEIPLFPVSLPLSQLAPFCLFMPLLGVLALCGVFGVA
jgi:hypothetical protein